MKLQVSSWVVVLQNSCGGQIVGLQPNISFPTSEDCVQSLQSTSFKDSC